MWELLEGQENGRAQGLPRDERCAALLNLALLDSMSGKPDRSSHAMEAALREADGDEAMSRLVWEEYMALATTALTCYSTEVGHSLLR